MTREEAFKAYPDLRGANLSGTDLYGANLSGANLSGTDLYGANLRGANLRGANLRKADLYGANLRKANLFEANLYEADLRWANLSEADLRWADLRWANLYGANLSGTDLSGATLPAFQTVPSEGSFIAYKRTRDDYVLKLEILTEAVRTSSLVGRKCRASAVRVLAWKSIGSNSEWSTEPKCFVSIHDVAFKYTVGQVVSVENFDSDIRVECTSGIHFFITEEEAENYV